MFKKGDLVKVNVNSVMSADIGYRGGFPKFGDLVLVTKVYPTSKTSYVQHYEVYCPNKKFYFTASDHGLTKCQASVRITPHEGIPNGN